MGGIRGLLRSDRFEPSRLGMVALFAVLVGGVGGGALFLAATFGLVAIERGSILEAVSAAGLIAAVSGGTVGAPLWLGWLTALFAAAFGVVAIACGDAFVAGVCAADATLLIVALTTHRGAPRSSVAG